MPLETVPFYTQHRPKKPLLENRDLYLAGEPTEFPYSTNISPHNISETLKEIDRISKEDMTPNNLQTLEDYFMRTDNISLQKIIVKKISYLRNQILDEEEWQYLISKEQIQKTLEALSQKENLPYFLRKELRYLLTKPLDHYTRTEQENFIQETQENFYNDSGLAFSVFGTSEVSLILNNLSQYTDAKIDTFFRKYQQSAPELFLFEECQDLKKKFHSPEMENSYGVKKDSHSHTYAKLWPSSTTFLNKVSPDFGALYTELGEVHCFFQLDPNANPNIKKKVSKIDLTDILREEGLLSENETVNEELEESYLFLLQPRYKEMIEKEIGISLENFSIRNQVQILSFLLNKTDPEIQRVFTFLNNTPILENKIHRLTSFLSLEQGGNKMGEDLLTITEYLSQEDSDSLFSTYFRFIQSAPERAQRLSDIFSDTFKGIYESSPVLNKETITKSLHLRANTLFSETAEKIHLGETIGISETLQKIQEEETAQETLLEEISHYIETIRTLCIDLRKDLLEKDEMANKKRISLLEEERFSQENEEDQEFLELEITSAHFDDAELAHEQDITDAMILSEQEISHLIKEYSDKNLYTEIPPSQKQALLGKLSCAKTLYQHLQRKFEDVLYGRESAVLSQETLKNLSLQTIDETPPELKKECIQEYPPYFPVGISADLNQWEKVFSKECSVAKPIELYSYLFWLNNQESPVEIVICDTIQTNNYLVEYPHLTQQEAYEKARQIGSVEAQTYRNIMDTFGLHNISLVRYDEFLSSPDRTGERKTFQEYKTLCEKFSQHPLFENALLNAVQESRAQTPEEKKRHIGYATEEVAWTLAKRGTKIGHVNEARYDALSFALEVIEEIFQQENKGDILARENEAFLQETLLSLGSVLAQNFSRTFARLPKNTPQYDYLKQLEATFFGNPKTQGFLKRSQVGKKKEGSSLTPSLVQQYVQKHKLFDRYISPSVSSASFGYRQAGKKEESVVKFREPYSTYFYDNPAHIFLHADQIVAIPQGALSGKILTLPVQKQQEYAQKVIRPLIIEYFKTLKTAPEDYFLSLGKEREVLFEECRSSETLTDLLSFVQKYIVRPSTNRSTDTAF